MGSKCSDVHEHVRCVWLGCVVVVLVFGVHVRRETGPPPEAPTGNIEFLVHLKKIRLRVLFLATVRGCVCVCASVVQVCG